MTTTELHVDENQVPALGDLGTGRKSGRINQLIGSPTSLFDI
jgi:hypothetical protein